MSTLNLGLEISSKMIILQCIKIQIEYFVRTKNSGELLTNKLNSKMIDLQRVKMKKQFFVETKTSRVSTVNFQISHFYNVNPISHIFYSSQNLL